MLNDISPHDDSKWNPFEEASFLSRLLFLWPLQLVKDGASKSLTLDDLPVIPRDDRSENLNHLLKTEWEREKLKEKPSLLKALFRAFAPKYMWLGLILIVESGVRIFQAILLGYFVDIMLNGANNSVSLFNNGYFVSFLITFCGILIGLMHHQYFFYGWRFGMQVRISMSSLIYDKAVRLHLRSLNITESSHIINLSSQDVESFQQAGIFIHFLYIPLLEAIAILVVGIREVGYSFIAGFACVILLVPLQSLFSRTLTQIRTTLGKRTDERIKLVSQALGGARLMKINGWENAFRDIIGRARKLELKSILSVNYIKGINEAIFFTAPVVIGCITFVTFHENGGVLTAQKVFTVLTLFSIIQFTLTKVYLLLYMLFKKISVNMLLFCFLVQFETQAYVAIQRTQKLLMLEEISQSLTNASDETVELLSAECGDDQPSGDVVMISMKSFNATWASKDPTAARSKDIEAGSDTQISNVLTDINLEVRRGELIVVVGPVGASKTSLLMAMMGELAATDPQPDTFYKTGKLAYCAQEPWIMSTTVKNNIIFGAKFDEERYLRVLKSCDLLSDLQLLSNGDETIIGDKGVNLSGGQRARVGLARAVYSDADVYLLDDPLSAVDPKVGNTLFKQAICEALDGKTRVLVTHQVQFLSSACVSRVAVINGGKLVSMDTFPNLKAAGSLDWLGDDGDTEVKNEKPVTDVERPRKLIEEGEIGDFDKSSSIKIKALNKMKNMVGFSTRYLSVDNCEDQLSRTRTQSDVNSTRSRTYSALSAESEERFSPNIIDVDRVVLGSGLEGQLTAYVVLKDKDIDDSETNAPCPVDQDGIELTTMSKPGENEPQYQQREKEKDGGIIAAEDRNIGNVTGQTYFHYFEAMGGALVCFVSMLLMVLGQASAMYCTVWLAYWAHQSSGSQDRDQNLNIYVALVVACVVLSLSRSALAFITTTRAAARMHDAMLNSVLRATVLFFDSNPIGRILNRFSKDQFFVDDLLPPTFYDFIQCALMVLGAIALVSVGSPMIMLILIPLVPYFLYLRKYFLQTSREVKRIDAVRRSPVFSHIAESLDGLTTIRAFGKLKAFSSIHKLLLDAHTRPDFAFMSASRWLGFQLDVTVVVLMAASTFGAVAAHQYQLGGSPEALSAGVMYVLQLAGLFQWCIRQSAEVENMMVSVERLVAYSNLTSERALHGPMDLSDRPNWPEKGLIEATDIICSYRVGSPLVLRGVSFKFNPGERVGVVGRTGAGKSTLISVLLRLIEYQSGTILIDGVDIKEVGLHDLRPNISVIPQVPFLFTGTIRENMDVFHKYTDDDIWRALHCVSLGNSVRKLDPSNGLAGIVAENGSNFSVGERQLFCLARAILQRNKILIMDEATANVDLETDERVQLAIKKEFSNSTVIMVAHRILTVIDCDQILVMSDGLVFESGHPFELLSKHLGVISRPEALTDADLEALSKNVPKHSLASMVLETGYSMTRQLVRLACAAWQKKKAEAHSIFVDVEIS